MNMSAMSKGRLGNAMDRSESVGNLGLGLLGKALSNRLDGKHKEAPLRILHEDRALGSSLHETDHGDLASVQAD
jgi:hypothetical protein